MARTRRAPIAIADYIRSAPAATRARLQELRSILVAAAPDAEEVISYRMPALRQNGIVVYYAAYPDHLSLFAAAPLTRSPFAAELRPYASGKGTVRFVPDEPLPRALLTKVVKARVAENGRRAQKRKPTKG